MPDSSFRDYSSSDALRSDRSAGDRARHRHKVRQAIRENIADIIAEESIIGQGGDKVVKVPIRGIKEYRFVFGENNPGVGTGNGDTEPGQVVDEGNQQGQGGGQGGDQPGVDYYETEISLEELIDIMFEDLELPDLERRKMRDVVTDATRKRKGFRKVGVRVHLDKRRTAISRIKRKLARQQRGVSGEGRFPFHDDDLTYRRLMRDEQPQSNAVVFCLMDTSGSMDTLKKYLARSFFFLLYQFVKARYQKVEVVFIAHHTKAREVTEEEFFTKGESGGTMVSSAYLKTIEVIQARFHPSLWNIYAFHCSDGDNWEQDNAPALKAARRLAKLCNLFGYGEIKPAGELSYGQSLLGLFRELGEDNFQAVEIHGKDSIWPAFKALMRRESAGAEGETVEV